ncbi:MAG: YdeI/OmpD-associated family protein [Nanoarchaeota archaeon]
MPEELKKALNKNKTAKKHFEKSPPSTKRTTYRWILHAKLPETRMKRINRAVKNAEAKKKVL